MATIPIQNLVQAVIEEGLIENKHRPYLGMSQIGAKCPRKLWYDFHWAYKEFISKRQMRIFERGDLEEDRVTTDIYQAGMEIHSIQFEVFDDTGHIFGHIDGVVEKVPGAEKTPHLLEIKTMKASRYSEYIKKGLRATNPTYYAQMNQYMGYMKLTRCLFVVTNKDTEERNYQRYEFDKENFDDYKRIGFSVLSAESAPRKIGDKTWLDCKMCYASIICHNGHPIEKNCRTCVNAVLSMGGKWNCSYHYTVLSEEEQRKGCEYYALDKNAFEVE